MKRDFSGVIFDINGTMVFDSNYHREAWFDFIPAHTGKPITLDDVDKLILGRDNRTILTAFLGELSDDEVERLTYEKEADYRRRCVEAGEKYRLVDGLAELLDAIKAKKIPMTIATGSEINNVNFIFDRLGLDRWFDRSRIVYDDGTVPGKPNPEIYLRAAQKLNLAPAECVVFEDSYSGVAAAVGAGIGKIAVINQTAESVFPTDKVISVSRNFYGIAKVLGL